jgi:hypothetical protein
VGAAAGANQAAKNRELASAGVGSGIKISFQGQSGIVEIG